MTERENAQKFDNLIRATGLFTIYQEVTGDLKCPAYLQEIPDFLRIDRVLLPTNKLISSGWVHDAIGIEFKRSGTKIGRAISQCIDYRLCSWRIPEHEDWGLDYIFLYPYPVDFAFDLASVMAQRRIGTCCALP